MISLRHSNDDGLRATCPLDRGLNPCSFRLVDDVGPSGIVSCPLQP
jgi:hypothetical protein